MVSESNNETGSAEKTKIIDRLRRFKPHIPSRHTSRTPDHKRKNGIFLRLKRHGPNKVYVLKGYTTKERIAEKRRRERRIQRNINIILIILFILGFIILFYWLDPIGRFTELARMLGL